MLARDLTDPEQNQAVLDLATALLTDPSHETHQPPGVVVEARAAARSRLRLLHLKVPVHLSVVWAMYGETGRMSMRQEHPHGEDFVRVKVRQLDWLTEGTDTTWSIVACDDGCPLTPSSAELMSRIVESEGYPQRRHRGVRVIRLDDVIAAVRAGNRSIGAGFDRLTSSAQSRKGGSILAALQQVLDDAGRTRTAARQVVCYTDADLSANLAQLGTLAAPIVEGRAAVLGQRYGLPGAVLVKPDGPMSEPRSTGDKPDKLIVLFRHMVRAALIPDLAHVLDTQAGFKAFDAGALSPVLREMTSFDETFDVELLIHLAHRCGPESIAVEPITFTEDFAATNFPSVDPGVRHLAMVHQVVDLYDRLVAPVTPASGETADLLDFVRGLNLDSYVRLIERLKVEDAGDPTLFERRFRLAPRAAG